MKLEPQDNFPEVVILHHSAGNGGFDSIQNWHINGRGWENIGYQWLLEKDGQIRAGRPETYHGAHVRTMNKKSIGICMVGNFNNTTPTKEQKLSLRKLYKDIQTRYPDIKMKTHRNYSSTQCPGRNLSDEEVQEILEKESFSKEEFLVDLINFISNY